MKGKWKEIENLFRNFTSFFFFFQSIDWKNFWNSFQFLKKNFLIPFKLFYSFGILKNEKLNGCSLWSLKKLQLQTAKKKGKIWNHLISAFLFKKWKAKEKKKKNERTRNFNASQILICVLNHTHVRIDTQNTYIPKCAVYFNARPTRDTRTYSKVK